MAADLERRKQVRRDEYYMRVAETVETGADCLGSNVGAVIVLENRIISTGYNGTPTGFGNCKQNGCVRCLDSWLFKQGREDEMSDPTHVSVALDRCICVHAEQNAIVTAARFGIRVQDATLYTTQSPCFGCLKESLQAGISRIRVQELVSSQVQPRSGKAVLGVGGAPDGGRHGAVRGSRRNTPDDHAGGST